MEVAAVIGALHLVGVCLVQVEVIIRAHDAQILPLLLGCSLDELGGRQGTVVTQLLVPTPQPGGSRPPPYLVVDVEVPLALVLAHHARLLQQEVGDLAPVGFSTPAELDLKVFSLLQYRSCSEPWPCLRGFLIAPKPFPTAPGALLGCATPG